MRHEDHEMCWDLTHSKDIAPHVKKTTSVESGKKLEKSDLLFIKHLDPADKSKIALMIQQIVKLEQTNSDLAESYENLKSKFEKKSNMFVELEEYSERMRMEIEQKTADIISKSKIISDYSKKLAETSKLLKVASETNKKLQKKLSIKKKHVEIQTDETEITNKSLQTSTLNNTESDSGDIVGNGGDHETQFKDGMTQFLDKLNMICDRLNTADRAEEKHDPVNTSLVHNHKRDGSIINPEMSPAIVYNADSDVLSSHKDSILVIKERTKCRADLLSLIEDIEDESQVDDQHILDELFFKIKS